MTSNDLTSTGQGIDTARTTPTRGRGRFTNGWPTVPLRVFLASVFLFAAYAKFTYPGFFDPNSTFGFKSAVASAKPDSPISGLLTPMVDHASLFGHVTAVAELLIGLGLLVGLLTRIAALGGIVLAVLIVLSVNWNEVKEYTGNGGWFTSVDLVTALALTVFVIGGAGPLSLDEGIGLLRRRRRDKNEALDRAEPRFTDRDSDLADSRRRLAGEPDPAAEVTPPRSEAERGTDEQRSTDEQSATEQLPPVSNSSGRQSDSMWREPDSRDR